MRSSRWIIHAIAAILVASGFVTAQETPQDPGREQEQPGFGAVTFTADVTLTPACGDAAESTRGGSPATPEQAGSLQDARNEDRPQPEQENGSQEQAEANDEVPTPAPIGERTLDESPPAILDCMSPGVVYVPRGVISVRVNFTNEAGMLLDLDAEPSDWAERIEDAPPGPAPSPADDAGEGGVFANGEPGERDITAQTPTGQDSAGGDGNGSAQADADWQSRMQSFPASIPPGETVPVEFEMPDVPSALGIVIVDGDRRISIGTVAHSDEPPAEDEAREDGIPAPGVLVAAGVIACAAILLRRRL